MSGRVEDLEELKAQLDGLAKKAHDEKFALTTKLLDDPDSKYYNDGIDDDPDSPEYAPELKAIDDKYAAQGEKLQAQADKLKSDPDVKKRLAKPKDDLDRLLDGDDDWDNLFKTDAPKSNNAGSKGGKTTTRTSSSSTTTVNRTVSGGTTRTGGGSTVRKSAQYDDTPESEKLFQQAKDIRRNQMPAFAKKWRKENPNEKRFRYTKDPEYIKLKKKYEDLRAKAQKARKLVSPASTTVTPSTTTFEPAQ